MTRTLDLTQVVENAAPVPGFVPRMVTEGPSDLIPAQARPEILAVAQEALTNAAEHADATHVTVSLTVAGPEVRLVIADDGVGVSPTGRRSGLANMQARAQQLGGDLAVLDNEPRGTIIDWHAPSAVPRDQARTLQGE